MKEVQEKRDDMQSGRTDVQKQLLARTQMFLQEKELSNRLHQIREQVRVLQLFSVAPAPQVMQSAPHLRHSPSSPR